MSEHTKCGVHVAANGRQVMADDGYPIAYTSSCRESCEANAKRLALCWNMHDELVAALRTFLDMEGEVCSFVDSDTGTIYSDLCAQARAVLTKLEGGAS